MKGKFNVVLLILAVLLIFSLLRLEEVCFASEQEFEFEILERGDVSGYFEEAYFVVENEADWVRVWEKHTSIFICCGNPPPPPIVDFSVNFVVCAFMGECPTAGYSVDIERIWTDGKQVFVEVVKRCPPKDAFVAQVITSPYVMALVKKTDMPFVFRVNGNGDGADPVFSEFPSGALLIMVFVFICLMVLVLKVKEVKWKE